MKKSTPQSGIIRVEKDRTHPYKTINTSFATDERLTWGARGLLVYLLSKPDDWKVMVPDLIKQSSAGRDAVYKILKNLEETGYLQRIRTRRDDGTFEYSTVIYEKARPLTAFPETVQPETVQPYTEKPDVYKVRKELTKERLTIESGGGASDDQCGLSVEVETRLRALTMDDKQLTIIAAAAAARGGFSLSDVETCERWVDAQRKEWAGKYGSLYNTLKAGKLPVMPRSTGPQQAPPQPVLTMAEVKRQSAEMLAADPELARIKEEIRANGW